jgi:hypothetical protein
MSTLIIHLIINQLNNIVSVIHIEKSTKIDKCVPVFVSKYFLKCDFSIIVSRLWGGENAGFGEE